jgi:ribosome-associated protein
MRRILLNQNLSDLAVDGLQAIKALDIVVINVTSTNSLFDQIIVASVDSTRQARAFVNNLKECLKETKYSILSVEGEASGEWVLIDLGDIIVHVMKPGIRDYYNLEDLWQEIPSSQKNAQQQAN